MTDARYTYTAGMPAARVGWLVARARSIAGIGERDLASSVGVPVRTVRRWERGDLVPSDDEVEAIASACGARLTELLPRRNVVAYDPSTGIMQMADQAVAIPVTSLDNDTVLAAFVALVRRVRGLRLDQDVKVRQEDLDALGEVLDLDDEELEERLMRIIGMSRSQAAAVRAQLLRKRLAVPMVGMLASLSLLGVNRLFTTGSEQVKAIDGKVEMVIPIPTTTTTVASSSDGGAAAPVVTAAPAAASSSAAVAPSTQAASPAASESPVQVTSTTQPFIGPKFPVTVRTGPPATTPGRRPAAGNDGVTSPIEPGGGSPVTEPPSGGGGGGGGSTTTPVTQPPTSPPTTGQPPVSIPPTPPPVVPPIATTDGSTGTIEPPPPPTTTSTTTPPDTDPTTPTTSTTTTVPPIDDGHTTETTLPPPPPPPSTVGGIGTTGGTDPGSS